ncbi:MAG: alpha/beta hydrolase [Reyranella sp.]|nr:alpha/beta hydrolase [Reyranella sp.]
MSIWIGLPYMERRWTFSPARSLSADRWQKPADALEVAFPTDDGVQLVGWFLAGAIPRNGVSVLALSGSLGVLPESVPQAQFLQSLGFNVLLFDFRGFGKSEGTSLSEATLNVDGAAALRYLTKERGVDPQSIALIGSSLGAAVAANLATSYPCRAVALIGAFGSAKTQGKRIKPWMPDFVFDLLSSPLDTTAKIDRANCPVLIVHGADDAIPLEEAEAIFDAAPLPKRLIVIPDAEHAMSDSIVRDFLDDVASFFINRR